MFEHEFGHGIAHHLDDRSGSSCSTYLREARQARDGRRQPRYGGSTVEEFGLVDLRGGAKARAAR